MNVSHSHKREFSRVKQGGKSAGEAEWGLMLCFVVLCGFEWINEVEVKHNTRLALRGNEIYKGEGVCEEVKDTKC